MTGVLFSHWLFWLKNWRFSTNSCKGFIESFRIQWRLIFAVVIGCSRLRPQVGYFIFFRFTLRSFNGCLSWMFNSVKDVKYLLTSYYWEKLTFSKLRFSKFKKLVTRSVFGELQLTQISLNFKILKLLAAT